MFDKFGVVGSSDRGSESIGIKSTKKSPNAEEIINNLLSKEKKVIKEEDLTDGHIETIKSWLNSKPGLEEEKIKEALKNLILILKKLPPDSKHILPICSLIIKTKKQPYFVINVLEELTRFFRPGMVDQKSEYLVEGLSLLKNIRELKPEFAEPIIKDHSEKVEKGQEASTNYYKLVNNFCFLFIGDLKEQLAKGEGKRNKRKILFSRINEKWGKDAIYIFLTTPSISKFLIKESKALDWIFDNWIDNKKQFKKFTWAERVEILCALSGNLFPEKIRNFAKEYVTKHSEAFKKELQKVLDESSVDTQKLSNLGELGLRYNIIDTYTAFRVIDANIVKKCISEDVVLEYVRKHSEAFKKELQKVLDESSVDTQKLSYLGEFGLRYEIIDIDTAFRVIDANIVKKCISEKIVLQYLKSRNDRLQKDIALVSRALSLKSLELKDAREEAIKRLIGMDWSRWILNEKEIKDLIKDLIGCIKTLKNEEGHEVYYLSLILGLCFAPQRLLEQLKNLGDFKELLSEALKAPKLPDLVIDGTFYKKCGSDQIKIGCFAKAVEKLLEPSEHILIIHKNKKKWKKKKFFSSYVENLDPTKFISLINDNTFIKTVKNSLEVSEVMKTLLTDVLKKHVQKIKLETAKDMLGENRECCKEKVQDHILWLFKKYANSETKIREEYALSKSNIKTIAEIIFERPIFVTRLEITKIGKEKGSFERCLELVTSDTLLDQFGNYDDTVKAPVCGYLCETAFDDAIQYDAILKYICDNNFEISPELSSEQFRQIIEKAIERKIPFNPACILNNSFNLESKVVKQLVHQYLSSIDEDNENLEKFIQQSLMYHEHFGRNLDWLYKVLVEKPETISKRSREYILQYLPLVADVFRKNPENVRTHRLVAEFCGFAVKKENIEKLNYLGKDVERMESIETILNFKEVHEESYKDLRGKLRDFHKEEWAGDSKFKKALWHILDFFGKWKGKIELNMKESVKSKDNKEATTSYILSQIKEKAACAKKVTSAEKEAEKRRDKLAKEMAQTLIKFKKAGGEIEEGQKKQFGKAIGKFFPKAPEEKSSSKPSREKRRLQQAASELGIA